MSHESVKVLDPDVFRQHINSIQSLNRRDTLRNHDPTKGFYWKSLDLAHVALHLNSYTVWDTGSVTGGSHITPDKTYARDYQRSHSALTIAAIEQHYGQQVPIRSTRLLVGLDRRVGDFAMPDSFHTDDPQRSSKELITTSMRLTDIDKKSQALIRSVFSLGKDFDTEFVVDSAGVRPDIQTSPAKPTRWSFRFLN